MELYKSSNSGLFVSINFNFFSLDSPYDRGDYFVVPVDPGVGAVFGRLEGWPESIFCTSATT